MATSNNFICGMHGIPNVFNCPDCSVARRANEAVTDHVIMEANKLRTKEQVWPPVSPTPSGLKASNSRGILEFTMLINQINALRLNFVGEFSGLVINSPLNTGVEYMEQVSEIYAIFVKLQTELEALLASVKHAEKSSITKTASTSKNT